VDCRIADVGSEANSVLLRIDVRLFGDSLLLRFFSASCSLLQLSIVFLAALSV
jgi:hypothetical protein